MAVPISVPSEILSKANKVMSERASQRDVQQERSMEATVRAFNAMHGTYLTTSQGWSFMTLLKMKRSFTGDSYREDDFIDEAAYTALRAESRADECSMGTATKPMMSNRVDRLNGEG